MIYADISYKYNKPVNTLSLISQMNYGQESVFDLFSKIFSAQDQVEIPAKSLESSLKAIRLDADLQAFKKDWRWVVSANARSAGSAKIDAEYQKLMKTHSPSLINIEYHHFFASLGLASGISSLWMPGVAMIASHLTEKKGLKDLFVCANRQALVKKVEEVITSPNDERCAIIVGSDGSTDRPLHKFTFCIEKKEGEVKIMLLDSMGTDYFSASPLNAVLGVCKSNSIFPEVFFSGEKREFAGYGCPVFALQDAVSFLGQEDFFQVIDFESTTHYDGAEVKVTKTLPPAFMIGAQSTKLLKGYKKENEALFAAPLPGRNKTLEEYVERNKVMVTKYGEQNHYITRKLFQYKQFILGALKELKDQEIQNLVYATLLT